MKKLSIVIASLSLTFLLTGCQQQNITNEIPPLPIEEKGIPTENPIEEAENLMNSIIGKSITEVLPEDEAEMAKSMLQKDDTYFIYLTHGCPHCQELVRQLSEDTFKRNVVLLLPEGMTQDYMDAFEGVERYKGMTIIPSNESVISQVIQYVPSLIVVDSAGIIKESTSNGVTYEKIRDNLIDK